MRVIRGTHESAGWKESRVGGERQPLIRMIVRICSDGTNKRGEMAASASDQSAPLKRAGAWLNARTGRPESPLTHCQSLHSTPLPLLLLLLLLPPPTSPTGAAADVDDSLSQRLIRISNPVSHFERVRTATSISLMRRWIPNQSIEDVLEPGHRAPLAAQEFLLAPLYPK